MSSRADTKNSHEPRNEEVALTRRFDPSTSPVEIPRVARHHVFVQESPCIRGAHTTTCPELSTSYADHWLEASTASGYVASISLDNTS